MSLEQGGLAALTSVGFALLFNVPPRVLPACALGGSLALVTRSCGDEAGLLSRELSSLLAATLGSSLSLALGRRLKVPAIVLIVPAVIPLIPGAQAFRTMQDLLELTSQPGPGDPTLLSAVIKNGTETLLITAAMACGVAMPSLVLRHRDPMT